MSFLKNIQEIRDRARQQIEKGAVTKDYKLDRRAGYQHSERGASHRTRLCTALQVSLLHGYGYSFGFRGGGVPPTCQRGARARGHNSPGAFGNSAASPRCIRRVIAETSHSDYREGTSLADMIREDLVAERIAIETYREIVTLLR